MADFINFTSIEMVCECCVQRKLGDFNDNVA